MRLISYIVVGVCVLAVVFCAIGAFFPYTSVLENGGDTKKFYTTESCSGSKCTPYCNVSASDACKTKPIRVLYRVLVIVAFAVALIATAVVVLLLFIVLSIIAKVISGGLLIIASIMGLLAVVIYAATDSSFKKKQVYQSYYFSVGFILEIVGCAIGIIGGLLCLFFGPDKSQDE